MVTIKNEGDLIANLKQQLKKHNNVVFTKTEFERVLTSIYMNNALIGTSKINLEKSLNSFDVNGDTQAVQIPLAEWKKVLNKLSKYEQALKMKSDLKEAFEQVALLRKSEKPKQTLNEFLDEL